MITTSMIPSTIPRIVSQLLIGLCMIQFNASVEISLNIRCFEFNIIYFSIFDEYHVVSFFSYMLIVSYYDQGFSFCFLKIDKNI